MSAKVHLGEDLAEFLGLGAELDSERRLACEQHLRECAECRTRVETARRVHEALLEPPLRPSSDFDARLFARLDGIDREARSAGQARREALVALFRPARWALAFGAAALAGVLVLRGRGVEPGRDPGSEAGEPDGAPSLETLASSPGALALLDALDLGKDLELLHDLEVAEVLDVAEDLELLLLLTEGEAG